MSKKLVENLAIAYGDACQRVAVRRYEIFFTGTELSPHQDEKGKEEILRLGIERDKAFARLQGAVMALAEQSQ